MNSIDLDFSRVRHTRPYGKWLFTGKNRNLYKIGKVHKVLICIKGNTLSEKEIL